MTELNLATFYTKGYVPTNNSFIILAENLSFYITKMIFGSESTFKASTNTAM